MRTKQMIKGFDEGLFFFKKGSVGRIFIPSMLGYGPSPSSPNIRPYEALIFDIEVLDVKDQAPAPPPPPPAPKK